MKLAEGVIELGYKQAELCRQDPETYLELLITAPSQRSILFNVYNSLRTAGRLKMLELLPENERREIWQEAKKLAKGRLPMEKLILLSKCLYTLNHLLQQLEIQQ